MSNTIWLLLVAVVLVLIGHYVTEGLIRMLFYVLALIAAVVAVAQLTGAF